MARSRLGLLCCLLGLLLALAEPVRASGYADALKQYVPPSSPQEVERALVEGWLPELAGHVDLNRSALDMARRASQSGAKLPSEPAALAALGRSLALRGVRRAHSKPEEGLEDLVAAVQIGEQMCSQADVRWLSQGLALERSAWSAYLSWLQAAPPEALAAAGSRTGRLTQSCDGLLRLVAAELAEARKQVLDFSQNPDGQPATENLGLLRRLRAFQREETYKSFAAEAAAYERLVRQGVDTGNPADAHRYLETLEALLAGRKGLRRVVVPSPAELARLLAAERFRSYADLIDDYLWTQAYWRAAPSLTAALSHRAQTGAWPPSAPPADPFGGRMVDRALGARLLLYSRGPDRADSGGKHQLEKLSAAQGRDIIFWIEVQDPDEP